MPWVRSWGAGLPGKGLWIKPEGREGVGCGIVEEGQGLHCRRSRMCRGPGVRQQRGSRDKRPGSTGLWELEACCPGYLRPCLNSPDQVKLVLRPHPALRELSHIWCFSWIFQSSLFPIVASKERAPSTEGAWIRDGPAIRSTAFQPHKPSPSTCSYVFIAPAPGPSLPPNSLILQISISEDRGSPIETSFICFLLSILSMHFVQVRILSLLPPSSKNSSIFKQYNHT